MDKNKSDILFTKKEQELLMHIAAGENNAVIADIMNVSIHTIKMYKQNIFQKLNAKTRAHAAVKAVRYGLIDITHIHLD